MTTESPRACERCPNDRAEGDDRFCAACRAFHTDACSLIVRGGLAILMDEVEAIRAARVAKSERQEQT